MIDPNEIQNKLRQGNSIDSICQEYGLTFKELFRLLKSYNVIPPGPNPKAASSTGELYIYQREGQSFFIRKGDKMYGSYSSLEDARMVRDYFILNGWNKRKLDDVCRKLGIKRKTKGSKS